MAIWILMAYRVKREYWRRSAAASPARRRGDADPRAARGSADDRAAGGGTVHADEQRVLYAIELLESLEKRHLLPRSSCTTSAPVSAADAAVV